MLLLCLELLEQKLYLTLWRLSHAIMGLHLTCLLLSLILRYFPRIFTRQNLTRLASTFTSIHSKTNFANSHFYLDRILHKAMKFALSGESLRRKH